MILEHIDHYTHHQQDHNKLEISNEQNLPRLTLLNRQDATVNQFTVFPGPVGSGHPERRSHTL